MSDAQNLKVAIIKADQIELVLNRVRFSLKGVIFSGKDPPATLSNDEARTMVSHRRFVITRHQ